MLANALYIGIFNIVLAVVGILAARYALAYFDRVVTRDPSSTFTQWWTNASSHDKAIYFSSRFLGVCLLVGLAIS